MDFSTIAENRSLQALIIYIIVLVPLMLLGFYFARRKMFNPHHKLTMTLVMILNWVLIAYVMANSYSFVAQGLPDNLSEAPNLIATIHGIVGLTAQIMATYLVLLMWTENTPLERLVIFRIKNIKTPMRLTLSLWLITVLLGFGVYGVWYGGGDTGDDAPPAATTEEAGSPAATEDAAAPDATEDAPEEPAATEESGDDEPAVTEDAPEEPVATEESGDEPAATEDAPEEPAATEESE